MRLTRHSAHDNDQRPNRRALVLVPLAVIAVLVVPCLLLGSTPHRASRARTHPRQAPDNDRSAPEGLAGAELRVARRAAREFIAGYLAAVYGRGRTADIEHAAPALRAELERNPPRVTPAQAAQRPRLRTLTTRRAPDGIVRAVARVDADGRPPYRLGLYLQRRGTGWTIVDVAPR